MPSNIDAKIFEAVMGKRKPTGMPMPNFVEKVKQAFADAGYVKVAKDNQNKIKSAQIFTIEHGTYELMTGQEWYRSLVLNLPADKSQWSISEIKRAAGLGE